MPAESNIPSALPKTREIYDVLDGDARFHSNELDEDANPPYQSGPMLVETLNRIGLPSAYDSSQIQINPFVEGYGVAVATGLPVAGHTRFHQQPLALVVVIGRYLVRQRGTRAHDAHPFCQDEKTRLPAEMLRLDS